MIIKNDQIITTHFEMKWSYCVTHLISQKMEGVLHDISICIKFVLEDSLMKHQPVSFNVIKYFIDLSLKTYFCKMKKGSAHVLKKGFQRIIKMSIPKQFIIFN